MLGGRHFVKPKSKGRGWRATVACTGRCQPEDAGWRIASQACRRAVGQLSGGHLAAPPGTVCCQAVSHARPQIPHFPARGAVVSACVGVVFPPHPLCDGAAAQPPQKNSQPWRSSARSLQAFTQRLTHCTHLTRLGWCLGEGRGRHPVRRPKEI